MKITRGVIIGKFMPPHTGHSYLLDFAASFVDELWVFVCSLPHEPIPGTLRYQWMQAMFPHITIRHIEEVNPQANRAQPGAQKIWAKAVLDRIGNPVDFVFASEGYGWEFAENLNATFVPVDPSRDQFPISATELREKPFRNWHFIPKTVRSWFVKTVVIRGSKEELVAVPRAATLLQTMYCPPYEDFYLEIAQGRVVNPQLIAQATKAQYEALKAQARYFLLVPLILDDPWNQASDLVITIDPSRKDIQNKAGQVLLPWDPDTCHHHIKDIVLDYWKELL